MSARHLPIVLVVVCLPTLLLIAQPDTSWVEPPDQSQEIIEDFLQNTDSEGNFDYNTFYEGLAAYRTNPINLNEANEAQLQDLRLLSDIQIVNLLRYRQEAGDLLSIYELQAVPGFDLNAIRRILPFVSVKGELDDFRVPITRMITQGRNELYLRWSRILEEQEGYTEPVEGGSTRRYLGDPNQLYVRYKHAYSNRLSYGITAEKDRGEEFFTGSNRQGFDFYSAHFALRNYNRHIKAVVIGDYAVSFGQGLILFNGFGYGKSAAAMNIKRTSLTVRPYTSVNEVDFLRGGAATIALGEHLEVTAFASSRRRDGNLAEPDTSELDFELLRFTSLDRDGLHRTPSEIEDENAIGQFTTGGSLKYRTRAGHVALNALYDRFDAELLRTQRPYNRFYFNGDRLLNASVDYSWIWQNFNFFGETAVSDNGAIATINGVLIGLDRKLDVAILHRFFPRDYQALNANPFAETTGGRNENGLYLGFEARPLPHWTLTGYFDMWEHPWIRFNIDRPSRGYEYRTRLTFYQKRRLRLYAEVREEVKEINAPDNETQLNYGIPTRLFQLRVHIANQISKTLEVRSRFDWGYTENEIDGRGTGVAFYQDVIYRPVTFPVSFTTRFALFDTPGFQTRFYSYENNLLYTFSIPAYYNRGSRFYLNIRYRGIRNLTIEARYDQTFWSNQDNIGSDLEEVAGPSRSRLSAQIKLKF